RYPEGTTAYDRWAHRTIFPSDFLADFGFSPIRWDGRVALARLELGGLQPVEEGPHEVLLRKVKEAFTPPPVPQRPGERLGGEGRAGEQALRDLGGVQRRALAEV